MKFQRYRVALVLSTLALLMTLWGMHDDAQAAGNVSLDVAGGIYTQDFNTLVQSGSNSTVPLGWNFFETGTNANTTYTAGTGSSNTGDTYSYGASGSSERAFGCLLSGSLVSRLGAQFTNNTGTTIQSLAISYTGEQWRLGQNTAGRAADRLDFQLSADATSLSTGAWLDHNGLDFSSPVIIGTVGALDGNAASNRTVLSFTITGLNIPNGGAFWIRWADSDLVPGADDGLAVDDFSLTPYTSPTDIALSNTSVVENAGADAVVGTLSGTDPDMGQSATLAFSLPAGLTDNDLFNISGTTLRANASFDYEVASSYTVTVRATDAVGLTYDEVITITVTDVSDPPTGSVSLDAAGGPYQQDFDTLAQSGSSGTVPLGWYFFETGTSTYVNTAYRADTGLSNIGDTYSYGVSGASERAFGCLLSNALTPAIGAQFINNTGTTIQSLAISYTGEEWRLGQNTAGRAADRLDFQLSTDATSLSTGTWADHNGLDFSSPVTTGTVGALDGNAASNRTALSSTITGLSIPNGGTFWIRWADSDLVPEADDGLAVDDFSLTPYTPPTDIALSNTSLPENAGADAVVGTLSGTDPDVGQSATLSFSLPAGPADNALFNISGTTLRANDSFDHEIASSYSVTVRATDAVGLTYDEAITITVTDVDEPPAITSNGGGAAAAMSVAENTTVVTTVAATDPDAGQTLTYSVIGGADQVRFHLDGSSGVLTFLSPPDFENPTDVGADNVYELTVQVTDNGTPALSDSQALTITVTDVAAIYTLIYEAGKGGSVAGPSRQTLEPGEDGTRVTAVPETGYRFYMWTDGLTTASRIDTDVMADRSVKALFLPDVVVPTYTLTYIAGEGGSISGESVQIVRQNRDGTEVTAVPDSGYRFVAWSDGVTTASRTDTKVRADLTVVAEFALVPDRWTDISNQQWVDVYGVTAEQVDAVADGYSDGTFRPSLDVSRAQFSKMVVDGFGLPTLSPATPSFSDVPVTHFYYAWIEGAAGARIVIGYPDGTFRPSQTITRQQANSILGRCLSNQELAGTGHIVGDLGTYPSVPAWYAAEGAAVLAPFADASEVSLVHAPYTAYLVYHNVVLGDGTHLMPLSNLTRAQAAVLIVRVK